jgi:hypothetical protein
LKHKNGVGLYPEIKVEFIVGHNPDLIVDGKQRIDLTKYKSREELHALFQSLGFVNVNPKFIFPRDKNENCKTWFLEGQCTTNALYMREYCSFSCNKAEKIEL